MAIPHLASSTAPGPAVTFALSMEGILRQRRKLVFPVFLLALLAQIFAPGAGGLAMRADAVAGTPGCTVIAGGAAGEQQTPPGQHRHSDQCCLLCQLPQAVDPAPMAAAYAALAPAARDVAWTFGPARVSLARAVKHTRARAPPSFS
ncbi:MAG: DUF2946 family protein [Methylocella sp.]